jgi:hypothetical protein
MFWISGLKAAHMAKLPYLANVIKEAMRMNSAAPQVNRWVGSVLTCAFQCVKILNFACLM